MMESITKVSGIYALGKSAGIKKGKKKDLAILYSKSPCNAAAVYTKNKVKGAPLYVTKNHLKNGKAQAITITSGIANVATGTKGLKDAKTIAEETAKELNLQAQDVLVASTGLIGAYLPMDKIKNAIKGTKDELQKRSTPAAKAILTTDCKIKQVSKKIGNITLGAIAKGAGMIHPNMATMLAFIFTDAKLPTAKLNKMLKLAVNSSFNMISVDLDTSTSDMVILMANGEQGKVHESEFQNALNEICIDLAKKIASDGEGATKLIDVRVTGAQTETQAKILAKSVISSNLVKTAAYGNDPNWGRIIAALGYANTSFNPKKVSISIQNNKIVKNGIALGFDKKKVSRAMKSSELKIEIDLKEGTKEATAYGCDLTHDYISINAEYAT